MIMVVVRVWLPDRPGALGQVASRIGAVRGDVLGIEILERGADRVVDELTVSLPSAELVPLLTSEVDAVDGVSVEDVFHGKNAQSALKLGHARGAILLAAAHHDLIIAEYAPRQIKKAVVGTGNATKDQVAFMVKQQLRLREVPTPADAADGVAAALCHCLMGSLPG